MEERKLKSLKSIRFEMLREIHNEIRQRAALRNITIKKWILEAIIVKMQTEDKYK